MVSFIVQYLEQTSVTAFGAKPLNPSQPLSKLSIQVTGNNNTGIFGNVDVDLYISNDDTNFTKLTTVQVTEAGTKIDDFKSLFTAIRVEITDVTLTGDADVDITILCDY